MLCQVVCHRTSNLRYTKTAAQAGRHGPPTFDGRAQVHNAMGCQGTVEQAGQETNIPSMDIHGVCKHGYGKPPFLYNFLKNIWYILIWKKHIISYNGWFSVSILITFDYYIATFVVDFWCLTDSCRSHVRHIPPAICRPGPCPARLPEAPGWNRFVLKWPIEWECPVEGRRRPVGVALHDARLNHPTGHDHRRWFWPDWKVGVWAPTSCDVGALRNDQNQATPWSLKLVWLT